MLQPRLKLYSYAEVTRTAASEIAACMRASRRSTGVKALARRDTAYGIYLGWRALVAAYPDQRLYHTDDARLEAMLVVQ